MKAKRILVPVDGSERNDDITPVLAPLAERTGGSIRLLRVFPVPDRVVGPYGRTIAYVDQEMDRLTGEGLDDLRRIEAMLDGIPVETVVRFGEPVAEILAEADAFDADLVALATAPRGRLGRALRPGVADRVVAAARVPTLVLQTRG